MNAATLPPNIIEIIFLYIIIMNILTKPSFYALALTGIISFIVILILITNFSSIMKLGPNKKIAVLSLVGLTIGVHGIIHLGMETVYKYNPLERLLL